MQLPFGLVAKNHRPQGGLVQHAVKKMANKTFKTNNTLNKEHGVFIRWIKPPHSLQSCYRSCLKPKKN